MPPYILQHTTKGASEYENAQIIDFQEKDKQMTSKALYEATSIAMQIYRICFKLSNYRFPQNLQHPR